MEKSKGLKINRQEELRLKYLLNFIQSKHKSLIFRFLSDFYNPMGQADFSKNLKTRHFLFDKSGYLYDPILDRFSEANFDMESFFFKDYGSIFKKVKGEIENFNTINNFSNVFLKKNVFTFDFFHNFSENLKNSYSDFFREKFLMDIFSFIFYERLFFIFATRSFFFDIFSFANSSYFYSYSSFFHRF
jgi:hypothetical protein